MANRVARLACWQGVRLHVDWSAIHSLAGGLVCVKEEVFPVAWGRGSQRMADRITATGCLGLVVLKGNIAPFVPIFQIIETVNVGSHAALGYGRARVHFYP